jgi:outer membrane protein OmpA-like peptidoglycan-associated protein
MRGYKFLCYMVILLFGLAGCTASTLKVDPVVLTDNPSSKIAQLESSLTDARAQQVNVLSPTWFAKSVDYLDRAKSGLSQQDSVADVLLHVANGRASLDKAKEYTRIARTAIGKTIKARDLANAAGAASFGEDYQLVEDQFIGLTTDIENDYLSRADKNQDKVTKGFADLELRAIKEKTLGVVRELLAVAEANGAKKIAPKTLAETQLALVDADQFITQQRYEHETMQEKAAQALFQAQRLGQVMALSNQVKGMLPEDVALWGEASLNQVTRKLDSRDLRNQTNEIQMQGVLESIASLKDDNQQLKTKAAADMGEMEAKVALLQSEIDAQRQKIGDLEGKSKEAQRERELIVMQEKTAKDRLAAERRFQQNFNEVQGMFAEDQAEVYKQGNNLVIRLKAIQFPIGKDLIMPDNYALLSVVRKAIRTFGEPEISIEGHTDNTGTVASNAILSLARAEAVRQYFIANGTLAEENVSAIGYGSERPLAANDTAEGRAINRRIDVIIKTQMTDQ